MKVEIHARAIVLLLCAAGEQLRRLPDFFGSLCKLALIHDTFWHPVVACIARSTDAVSPFFLSGGSSEDQGADGLDCRDCCLIFFRIGESLGCCRCLRVPLPTWWQHRQIMLVNIVFILTHGRMEKGSVVC